jgi:hypothetical protein
VKRRRATAFENNGLLCALLLDSSDEELVKRALAKLDNPFIGYNVDILMQAPAQLKSLVLFENYRFGLPARRENTLTVTLEGEVRESKDPVITIGRLDENRMCLADTNVSRRHCAIVNYLDDVWLYDLGSTQGVLVDGVRVDRKTYLEGVHLVRLGRTEFTLCFKARTFGVKTEPPRNPGGGGCRTCA